MMKLCGYGKGQSIVLFEQTHSQQEQVGSTFASTPPAIYCGRGRSSEARSGEGRARNVTGMPTRAPSRTLLRLSDLPHRLRLGEVQVRGPFSKAAWSLKRESELASLKLQTPTHPAITSLTRPFGGLRRRRAGEDGVFAVW
ncbi:hypothetical protein Fuma_03257 [Fuerstiella marisgermanici]|uniref:Uncharacterized protein n=1 Tax=Fuerstiella marisgermanici TaxID=1891926 RepID=A0A1P8WHV3_9PLAN|nr:hypothetical protein Fuma_03257 [Fuerstiella marisgermanici]